MATPTVYKWDDPGAPVIDSSTASTRRNQLQAIFRQCLTTGYGAKAGAGWTLVDDGVTDSDVMIFQQGGTGFAVNAKLRISTRRIGENYGCFQVAGAEDYSPDINTPVGPMGAIIHLHNTTQFGSYIYARNSAINGYPSTWVIVANERTVYAWFGRHSNNNGVLPADTSSTHQNTYSGLYGGFCFGDYENNIPGFQYNQFFSSWNPDFTNYSSDVPRNFSGLISGMDAVGPRYDSRTFQKHARYWAGVGVGDYTSYKVCTWLPWMDTTPTNGYEGPRLGYGWGGLTYPYPDNNELFLEKIGLSVGGVIQGYYPGLHQTLHSNAPNTWYPDTFQGTGDFSGQEFIVIPLYRGKLILRIDADWNSLGV